MTGIKIVYGGGSLVFPGPIDDVLAALKQCDVKVIDTAQLYGESETNLGNASAGSDFTIDTKWQAGLGPALTRELAVSSAKESLDRLKVAKVDVFYMHAPETRVPMDEYLAGVGEAYDLGLFERFGLSNYTAGDVRRVHAICKAKGYPLPSVYQGNYSPVARRQEEELFPTLRELGIAFYAYSPLAGGFLTKTKDDVLSGKGRFDRESMIGKIYYDLYARPAYLDALERWADVARESGIGRAELAYRWVAHDSPLSRDRGDALIVGARTVEQLKETVDGINRGPLPEKVVRAIDEIWESVKHEAPLDNLEAAKKVMS